jgi:hypothetical protein
MPPLPREAGFTVPDLVLLSQQSFIQPVQAVQPSFPAVGPLQPGIHIPIPEELYNQLGAHIPIPEELAQPLHIPESFHDNFEDVGSGS